MSVLGIRWSASVVILATGCGARSGLTTPDVGLIPDVVVNVDAGQFDAGPDASRGLPPVDMTCPGSCPFGQLTPAFPPFVRLLPPDVPASCSNGFQMGGVNGGCGRSTYTLVSTRAGGANAITLDVDFATYLAPDGVTVTGVDAAGRTYTLMQTCRLQTSTASGPSTSRPSDDTIRQFRLPVRAGTRQLDFDFGAVTTPMYIQVLGLCDFSVRPFTRASWWQAVP